MIGIESAFGNEVIVSADVIRDRVLLGPFVILGLLDGVAVKAKQWS